MATTTSPSFRPSASSSAAFHALPKNHRHHQQHHTSRHHQSRDDWSPRGTSNSGRAASIATSASPSAAAATAATASSVAVGLGSGAGRNKVSTTTSFSANHSSSSSAAARTVNSGRKRIRASPSQHSSQESSQWLFDSIHYPSSTFSTPAAADATHQSASSLMTVSAGLSPPPFINTKYKLAGGLDTPTRVTADALEALDSSYLDHDFRRTWATTRSEHDSGHQTITVTGFERERNGSRKRTRSSMEAEEPHKPRRESWGEFVFSVVGGIAGKMWEFCRGGAGAFQGFTAGGGAGYMMTDTTPRRISHGRGQSNTLATPIPGQYPEDIASGDNMDDERGDELGSRPAKRQHREWSSSNDWVFVSESSRPSLDGPLHDYTSRGSARQSISSQQRSYIPRPAPSSPKSPPRPRSSAAGASYATGSPANLSRNRAASFASPRATSRAHSRRPSADYQPSPVEIDVARYTAQRQREERQADASMRKLNQQLQAMIRQGKEALATKFEVEDFNHDAMDNGDDECYDGDVTNSEW